MSRAYDELPEGVRALDELQEPPRPLRSYVDLIGSQLDEVVDTIAAIAPEAGGRSMLADPQRAPASWLPWMAQMVGAPLAPASTLEQQRAAVAGASSGWAAGTVAAIIAAVRSTLTDPVAGHVLVLRDPTSIWRLHIVTKRTQTPDPARTLAAVSAAGARPAGVELTWTAYSTTWRAVETLTWDQIESLGSWDALEAYS